MVKRDLIRNIIIAVLAIVVISLLRDFCVINTPCNQRSGE